MNLVKITELEHKNKELEFGLANFSKLEQKGFKFDALVIKLLVSEFRQLVKFLSLLLPFL